jgi:hypothetical protein
VNTGYSDTKECRKTKMFFELFKGQKILKGINECVCIWIEEKQS